MSNLCPKLVASGGNNSKGGIDLAVGHLVPQEGVGSCMVVTAQRNSNLINNHKRQRKLATISQSGPNANNSAARKVIPLSTGNP